MYTEKHIYFVDIGKEHKFAQIETALIPAHIVQTHIRHLNTLSYYIIATRTQACTATDPHKSKVIACMHSIHTNTHGGNTN